MANANVEIVLTADGALAAKVKEATEAVEGLNAHAEHVGETLRSTFEGLPGILSGEGIETIISGFGDSFTKLAGTAGESASALGPLGVAIGGVASIAAIGISAIAGFVLAVKGIVEPQMEAIDSTYKMATALDVPIDKLMTFQNVAKEQGGLAADAVDASMKKLAKSLGEAETMGGPAKKALDELGLSATHLAGQGLGENFEEIVDRLQKIPGTGERAVAATALLGKQGIVLASAFREGAAGIEEAHEKGLAMHTVLSQLDAAKVVAAHRTFEELGEQIDGVKNAITVALAPSLEAIGEIVQSLVPDGDSMGDAFLDATKVIAYGLAVVMDALHGVKSTALLLADALIEPFNLGLQAVGYFSRGLVAVLGLIPGLGHIADGISQSISESQEVFSSFTHGVRDQLGEALTTPTYVSGVGHAFDEAAKHNQDSAGKLIDSTKSAGEAAAETQNEVAEKIQQSTQKMADALDFQKFLHGSDGGWGDWLQSKGVDASKIKDVYDIAHSGGSSDQVESAAKQAVTLQDSENADKAAKSLEDLHSKLDAVQAAAKAGIDPKLAEQMAALHLQPDQAGEFERVSDAIKKVNEQAEQSEKAKEHIKDLRIELAAAKAGVSTEDYKAQQADPADAAIVKGLQAQIDATKAAAKASEDAHKKMVEDAQKTFEETRTPIEKYWERVKELNEQLVLGKINQDTFNRARDEAAGKEHKDEAAVHKDEDSAQHSLTADVRRFSLLVPATGQDLQKQQLQTSQLSERWLRDLRNNALDSSNDSTVSIDDLA